MRPFSSTNALSSSMVFSPRWNALRFRRHVFIADPIFRCSKGFQCFGFIEVVNVESNYIGAIYIGANTIYAFHGIKCLQDVFASIFVFVPHITICAVSTKRDGHYFAAPFTLYGFIDFWEKHGYCSSLARTGTGSVNFTTGNHENRAL